MHNISDTVVTARKPHVCEECGRYILKGQPYRNQTNKEGGDIWTFKAHIDCFDLGSAYRTKNDCWRGLGDFLPMYELIEPHEFNEWRGHFPNAVCRLEFSYQMRDQ